MLRLYTFKSFENGIYRRDAVLETDSTVKYQLADIPLPDGIRNGSMEMFLAGISSSITAMDGATISTYMSTARAPAPGQIGIHTLRHRPAGQLL